MKGSDPAVGRETLKVYGQSPINCVSVHPDERRIAFGAWNGTCTVYDLLDQKVRLSAGPHKVSGCALGHDRPSTALHDATDGLQDGGAERVHPRRGLCAQRQVRDPLP